MYLCESVTVVNWLDPTIFSESCTQRVGLLGKVTGRIELTFIPQWAVTDLESCFLPHTFVGNPKTEKGIILGPLLGVLPVVQSP